MVKPNAQNDRFEPPGAAAGKTTKARIVEALLATLRDEGFAGTSARAIGRHGGFNQALIYYHFGSIPDLMIAALEDFSRRRLERYRSELDGASTLSAVVATMTRLSAEDVAAGDVTAVQEMVAGSSSSPDLGRAVVEQLEPWTRFAEEVVGRFLRGTAFASMLPAREIAYALVALYFGVETLAHLDPERARSQALFDAGATLAPHLDALLASGS
jgi:AcrR family transcriptional regulator